MSSKVVVLASEENIAFKIRDSLMSKGCEVVVTNAIGNITDDTSYLVVLNYNNFFQNLSALSEKILKTQAKTVVVNNVENTNFVFPNLTVKEIYIDQLAPFIVGKLNALKLQSHKPQVFTPKEGWLSVCTVEELVEKIGQELFSFAQSKRILFGKLVSFRQILTTLNPGVSIFVDGNAHSVMPRADLQIEETNTQIEKIISDLKVEQTVVIAPLPAPAQKRQITISLPSIPKLPSPNIKLPKIHTDTRKKLKYAGASLAVSVIILFLVPYLLLVVSGATTMLSYKLSLNGNFSAAKKFLQVANFAARASSQILVEASSLPLVGYIAQESGETAILLGKGTSAFGRVLSISDYAFDFKENSLVGGESIEVSSQKLKVELEALYKDLSFIEGEVEKSKLPFANIIPQVNNLKEYRAYILTASKIASQIPTLLGFDRPKTYLVLLQNNMELRPTGGFIGSFALLTFSKGELVDDTVYDVYSADGQLKGYIAPPEPIVEHLGEASWTLRDSNWDADFATSAKRAQWFLDKSIDRSVDGVVGINLEVAKDFLEVVGPVQLPNFSDTINSKNMYEKVQHEVEESFFPGSRKKAQYLSELSESLIRRITHAEPEELARLLGSTISNLNSRDIQVYFNESALQQIVNNQEWAGGINAAPCEQANCMSLVSGLVEANVGVNKANYFVSREVSTSVRATSGYLEQELTVKLKNNAADLNNIPELRYKAYVRAIAPLGSEFLEAKIETKGKSEYIDVDTEAFPGRVEYGLLADILPGEEKTVSYKWRVPSTLDFSSAGEIKHQWWKQGGAGEYSFEISYRLPQVGEISSSPPTRLTNEGAFLYNTNLTEDLDSILSWKP